MDSIVGGCFLHEGTKFGMSRETVRGGEGLLETNPGVKE